MAEQRLSNSKREGSKAAKSSETHLLDEAELGAQPRDIVALDGAVVQQDLALIRQVEAFQQLDDGAFAAARGACRRSVTRWEMRRWLTQG
jgi:hypothetical protein